MTRPQPIIDTFQGFLGPDQQAEEGLDFDMLRGFEPLLQQHGVTQTVLVQPQPSLTELERVLALADEAPWVGAVVGWVDLAAGDVEGVLDRLGMAPKFRGVCHPASSGEVDRSLLRADVLRGLRALADRGLSLDLLVEPRDLPSVGELAERLPELRMVIDHLGSPFIAQGLREPWGVYMLNLAPHRNVWCKLSGLVTRDTQPQWHVAHIRPFVDTIVRLFGYERLMFGSDWPMHLGVATYREVIETAQEAASLLTPAQEARLFHGSGREFYRLD